jgi:AraC-like DNA-binding protein
MSSPPRPDTAQGAAQKVLASAIANFAQTDGDHFTAIPALTLHRRSSPTEPLHCIYNIGFGVVAQGGKQVLVGSETMSYGPGQSMLTTIDVPVISHVTAASSREPFLGMMLTLDMRAVSHLASELEAPRARRDAAHRSLTFEPMDLAMLDAATRLVRLLGEPALVAGLAPLIQQEIVIRLLAGPHASQLRHLATAGSPGQQVAKAVAWLKKNFADPVSGDELAARAHMSPTTFRQHFRALTGVSPLQYQKQLRLQEARQLMLTENLDAGNASVRVGYESASQFSREYSRLFGAPPQRDVSRMRETEA